MAPSRIKSGDYVIIIHGIPLQPTKDTWQPVKDLLRKIMVKKPDQIHIEPGAVNVHANGYCSCSVKDEKAARKVHSWLRGNCWYGSHLTVWLFYGGKEVQGLPQGNITAFSKAQHLEILSPIKDGSLSRLAPLSPYTSTPILRPSSFFESPKSISTYYLSAELNNDTSNAMRAPHTPSPGISTASVYGGPNHISTYDNSPVISLSSATQSQINHSLIPLLLQQYAYQAFANHRPSQNGQIRSSITDNGSLGWTAPSTTTAVYGGFNSPPTTAYPMNYSAPVIPAGAVPSQPYHANSDGTAVHSMQGAIALNESRAVLIRNLNHQANPEDVRVHFSTAGIIEYCDIGASRKEKKRCTARLTFRSAAEARAAARSFDGTSFMGRNISAEVAKDDSGIDNRRIISETSQTRIFPKMKLGHGPLIVNGADEDPTCDETNPSTNESKGKGKEKGGDWKELTTKFGKVKLSK